MKQKLLKLFLLLPMMAVAQEIDKLPEVVPLKIETAYIPVGFDSNDRAQFVAEGILNDTCWKIGPHQVKMDPLTQTLTVQLFAYKYRINCIAMTVPYQKVIDIGILPAMPFKVLDGYDKKEIGKLFVDVAKTASADDYLYAPVTDVNVSPRQQEFTISGVFSNSCVSLKELRVKRVSHNVVVALPISETKKEMPCKDGIFPFSKTEKLPFLNEARYLLHVRSLDGQAANKLFTIGEPYLGGR